LIGRADEDALKVFHLRKEFIDLRDLPTLMRTTAVCQQAIGLIENKHRVFLLRFLEHSGDVLFALADVLAEKVRGSSHQQRFADVVRQESSKRRFPGAGRAMKTEGAAGPRPKSGDERFRGNAGVNRSLTTRCHFLYFPHREIIVTC